MGYNHLSLTKEANDLKIAKMIKPVHYILTKMILAVYINCNYFSLGHWEAELNLRILLLAFSKVEECVLFNKHFWRILCICENASI